MAMTLTTHYLPATHMLPARIKVTCSNNKSKTYGLDTLPAPQHVHAVWQYLNDVFGTNANTMGENDSCVLPLQGETGKWYAPSYCSTGFVVMVDSIKVSEWRKQLGTVEVDQKEETTQPIFTKELPKDGQFIVVWSHAGELWSSTLAYTSKGQLVRWNDEEDGWEHYSLLSLSEVDIIGYYSRK